MPRTLNSKTTTASSTVRNGADVSSRSGTSNSGSAEESTSTKTDSQSGESVKTGESRQFANVACRISFSIPILGRVPIDSNAPC